MDTNDRWEVENILFHMTHQWLYGQSTCESMLLFVSSPCSIKRISIPLKRERQPDTFAFTAYYRKSCHHCDFTFMSPCARACACRCDGYTSSPPLRQEWNAQAGKLHLTWRQKPLPHYNMTKKKRKKKKKKRCWSEHLCSEHYGNGLPDANTLPMGLALWIVWSHLHSSRLWCCGHAHPRARAEWLWSLHYELREVCPNAKYRCNIVITESWMDGKHRHHTGMTY